MVVPAAGARLPVHLLLLLLLLLVGPTLRVTSAWPRDVIRDVSSRQQGMAVMAEPDSEKRQQQNGGGGGGRLDGGDGERDRGVASVGEDEGLMVKDEKDRGRDDAYPTEDIQVGCRELRAKRYISDGFCTSTTPIKEVVCAGHCLPIRNLPWYAEFVKVWAPSKLRQWQCVENVVRRKSVHLLCRNGEYRTYRIKVVKSCKCEQTKDKENRTSRPGGRKGKKKRGRKGRKDRKRNRKNRKWGKRNNPEEGETGSDVVSHADHKQEAEVGNVKMDRKKQGGKKTSSALSVRSDDATSRTENPERQQGDRGL